jgi:hypothetical protein
MAWYTMQCIDYGRLPGYYLYQAHRRGGADGRLKTALPKAGVAAWIGRRPVVHL